MPNSMVHGIALCGQGGRSMEASDLVVVLALLVLMFVLLTRHRGLGSFVGCCLVLVLAAAGNPFQGCHARKHICSFVGSVLTGPSICALTTSRTTTYYSIIYYYYYYHYYYHYTLPLSNSLVNSLDLAQTISPSIPSSSSLPLSQSQYHYLLSSP